MRAYLVTQRGFLAVDGDEAGFDPFFHLATRTHTRGGQRFLQADRLDLAVVEAGFAQAGGAVDDFLFRCAQRQFFGALYFRRRAFAAGLAEFRLRRIASRHGGVLVAVAAFVLQGGLAARRGAAGIVVHRGAAAFRVDRRGIAAGSRCRLALRGGRGVTRGQKAAAGFATATGLAATAATAHIGLTGLAAFLAAYAGHGLAGGIALSFRHGVSCSTVRKAAACAG